MLICGTLIMMRRFVSCDNAVAACPAPMLATSRSASICSSFRSRTSSMPPPVSLDEPAGVENQRRDPVAHDGRSAEHRRSEEHTSELQSLAYLVCRLLLEKKKNNAHVKTLVIFHHDPVHDDDFMDQVAAETS